MSRSHKARNGTRCKYWKDTGLNSRSQKRAWSRTKKKRSRIARRIANKIDN